MAVSVNNSTCGKNRGGRQSGHPYRISHHLKFIPLWPSSTARAGFMSGFSALSADCWYIGANLMLRGSPAGLPANLSSAATRAGSGPSRLAGGGGGVVLLKNHWATDSTSTSLTKVIVFPEGLLFRVRISSRELVGGGQV